MKKKKVIFVCLGNICRSPSAEAILKKLVKNENLEDRIEVDSAGTIDYHHGEPSDPRMKKYAARRGYAINHLARKFNTEKDFNDADYIITMDNENYKDIKELDFNNKFGHKIFKMSQFSENIKFDVVPDPYYMGSEGFEKVLDILEDSSKKLLLRIKDDIKSESKRTN
jgi:protein-tyrosine phosphatase